MPFWVRDWIEDEEIQNMNAQTMASYLWLLCWNWVRGTLSSTPSTLLSLIPVRLRNHWLTKTWPLLKHHFEPVEGQPGRIVNRRLKRIRDELLRKQEGHRLGADITNAKRTAKRTAKLVAKRTHQDSDADADEEYIGPCGPISSPEIVIKQELPKAFDRWNALAVRFGLRKLLKWTPARERAYRARLRDHPDLWERIEAELPRLGAFAKEKGFVDFDFLTRPAKLEPFLEGKHRDRAAVQAVATTRPQVRELLKHVGRQVEADLGGGQTLKYTLLSAGVMHDHDRSVCFYAKLPDTALDSLLAALERKEAT